MDKNIVIPPNYGRTIAPLKIIKDSDKAVRIEFNGNDGYVYREWLPKSLCLISGEYVIAIADWFAHKKSIKINESANQVKEKEEPYYFAYRELAAEVEADLKTDPYVLEGELGRFLSEDPRFGEDIKTTDLNKIKQLIIANDEDGEETWTMVMGYIEGQLIGAIWVITERPDLLNHPKYEWLKTDLPHEDYGYKYKLIKPLTIKKETEKAILVTAIVRCGYIEYFPKHIKRDVWIPKSQAYIKNGTLLGMTEKALLDNSMTSLSLDNYKKIRKIIGKKV